MYLHELLKGLIQNLLDQSGDVCKRTKFRCFWILDRALKALLRQYV